MTIQGAIAELQNILNADDVPFYYKGGIQKVIETIQMEMADRKTEQTEPQNDDEFKLFDREDLILLIECQKERIAELLAKTEPNSSETPNNCTDCKWWFGYCHLEECDYEPKDEPQTDCPWK